MVVCIPVVDQGGLASPVSSHFRSAPMFMLVDTETNRWEIRVNRRAQGDGKRCEPVEALGGERIDAYLVGGIGLRALSELESSGARVFAVRGGTAAEALAAFVAGQLEQIHARP